MEQNDWTNLPVEAPVTLLDKELTADGLWWINTYGDTSVPADTMRIRRNALAGKTTYGDIRQFFVNGQIHLSGSFGSLLHKLGQLSQKYDDVRITRGRTKGSYTYTGWSDLASDQQITYTDYMLASKDITPASLLKDFDLVDWNRYHLWLKDGTTLIISVSPDQSQVKILNAQNLSLFGYIDDTIAHLLAFKLRMLEKDARITKIYPANTGMSITYWESITWDEYNRLQSLTRKKEAI